MKRKFKAFISILAVSAVISGCAETPASDFETAPVQPAVAVTEEVSLKAMSFKDRLAMLKWGMGLEDVMETIETRPDNTETEMANYDATQTLLTYENQVYEGYDSYLIVCVIDNTGLDGINYHIPTSNPESVYIELGKILDKKGGLYDPTDETFSFWHFDNENYTVMLANFGAEVQLSYFPLFTEEYRGYNCGSEFEYKDTEYEDEDEKIQQEEIYFFMEDNTLTDCEPIDMSLNCEEILLDRANYLYGLVNGFLNCDKDELVFGLEEGFTDGQVTAYRVMSDSIKSRDTIKKLFSAKIYEGYIDKIISYNPSFFENNGELYFIESTDSYVGTFETWYLGYDVTDDKIIGHFAVLGGVEDIGTDDAEYLNDENNYSFYDIIIQNVDGEYVLTDCNGDDFNKLYYRLHGWCYNSGKADRKLITNEKLKPKYIIKK